MGDFDNLGGHGRRTRGILEESFETVNIVVIGSLASFTARNPRRVG